MSDPRLRGKRAAILRALLWTAILATAVLFWISVGIALVAWISSRDRDPVLSSEGILVPIVHSPGG